MFKRNLVCENLSYSFGNKDLFKKLSLSFGCEKTGLVGSNGTGKTTLLKIIMGELSPQTGTVNISCKIGYLPQNFITNQDQTIAEVFGINQKISALERMNSGLCDQHDFEIIDDDWDVVERACKLLQQFNLGEMDLSRQIKTLSGGQLTRVFFARLLMNKNDFLILDEPTNNLDSESRLALYDVIKNFNGGLLIVSHDRQLLTLMDQIIELSPLEVKTYGGNYSDYIEQKSIVLTAREQDLVDTQKQLSKIKKTVQMSKERYEQRASRGKKKGREGGIPKILLGAMKNHAEKTKSKLEAMTDKQIASAKNKLAIAKSKIEQQESLDFELEATRVYNTKLVLDIHNLIFAYPEHTPTILNFNMSLVGPKRIAIAGKNGCGKTTLLKLIMGQLEPASGIIKIGVQHCAYLDQALSVLNPHTTILDNFKQLNSSVKETDCRLRLAAFLFAHDDALKLVSNLSGGEKMRAALACVLMGDTPPQLILLDEPTNNMDLASIASIEKALRSYKGALIAVSHDTMFLQNIGIEEKIELTKDVNGTRG